MAHLAMQKLGGKVFFLLEMDHEKEANWIPRLLSWGLSRLELRAVGSPTFLPASARQAKQHFCLHVALLHLCLLLIQNK